MNKRALALGMAVGVALSTAVWSAERGMDAVKADIMAWADRCAQAITKKKPCPIGELDALQERLIDEAVKQQEQMIADVMRQADLSQYANIGQKPPEEEGENPFAADIKRLVAEIRDNTMREAQETLREALKQDEGERATGEPDRTTGEQ
jgi:hypothetical protein